MIELFILVILDVIGFFVWNGDFVILFSLGFIWNWVASHDLDHMFEYRRYRFTTLKMVVNLQQLIQKPFQKFPEFVRLLARSLPAGLFWGAVIWFNDGHLPWWAVFMGSLTLELMQLNFISSKFTKNNPV